MYSWNVLGSLWGRCDLSEGRWFWAGPKLGHSILDLLRSALEDLGESAETSGTAAQELHASPNTGGCPVLQAWAAQSHLGKPARQGEP